jgi:hypothetical protein
MLRANERGQIKRAAAGNHIRNCPGDPTQRSLAPVPSSRNFDRTALIARGRPRPARPAAAVAIDTKQGRGHSPRASLSPGKRVPQAWADHRTRRP